MARFIDSDKLIWQVQNNDKYGTITKQVFISLLQNSETEDVAPVIHAHWEYRYDTGIYQTEFLCSRCKGLIETYSCTVDEVEYEYCPHCGAKMDEEEQ